MLPASFSSARQTDDAAGVIVCRHWEQAVPPAPLVSDKILCALAESHAQPHQEAGVVDQADVVDQALDELAGEVGSLTL
jgi:hypothetical protein